MTDKLLTAFKQTIKEYTLVPSRGGCFEVEVNGELIYSKLKTGEFPNEDTIQAEVQKRAK